MTEIVTTVKTDWSLLEILADEATKRFFESRKFFVNCHFQLERLIMLMTEFKNTNVKSLVQKYHINNIRSIYCKICTYLQIPAQIDKHEKKIKCIGKIKDIANLFINRCINDRISICVKIESMS
jgi:hypothetical protein